MGTKGARPKNAAAALKALEDQQKARAKRLQRDSLDRVLTELTTWYRDVLGVQTGALGLDLPSETGGGPHLINAEQSQQVARAARGSSPEQTLRRIDAILATRESAGIAAPAFDMASNVESLLDATTEGVNKLVEITNEFNELLYDAVDTDNDVFVELRGPAGTSLSSVVPSTTSSSSGCCAKNGMKAMSAAPSSKHTLPSSTATSRRPGPRPTATSS